MRSSSRHYFQARLDVVLRHLVSQPANSIDTAHLAEIAGYSRCHFSRLAKSALEEDISMTARRVRLESAAYRLLRGCPVKEAAFDVGIESPEVLSRAFKASYGVSPGSFCDSGRTDWKLPSANDVHWSPDSCLNEYCVKYDGEWNAVVRRPQKRYANIRRTVNYSGVTAVWEELRRLVPESLWDAPDVSYTSVFHDDFRQRRDGLTLQAGMELPEGAMVPSGLSVERVEAITYIATVSEVPLKLYSPTWRGLIRRWSTDDDKGIDCNLGFDEHKCFPRLELGIQTRMFYTLNTGS